MAYGLGALGEARMTRGPRIVSIELDITTGFSGHADVRNATQQILAPLA